VEHIHTGEFLNNLQDLHLDEALAQRLVSYNETASAQEFAEQIVVCPICKTSVKGRHTSRLSCEHTICNCCLSKSDGSSESNGRTNCPHPKCRQKPSLECPRPGCCKPIPLSASVHNSGKDKLQTCPHCGFAFCSQCLKTWYVPLTWIIYSLNLSFTNVFLDHRHGSHTLCEETPTSSIIHQYISLSHNPNDPIRISLENRFGRDKLQTAIAHHHKQQAYRTLHNPVTKLSCGFLDYLSLEIRGEGSADWSKTHDYTVFTIRFGERDLLAARKQYEYMSTTTEGDDESPITASPERCIRCGVDLLKIGGYNHVCSSLFVEYRFSFSATLPSLSSTPPKTKHLTPSRWYVHVASGITLMRAIVFMDSERSISSKPIDVRSSYPESHAAIIQRPYWFRPYGKVKLTISTQI
jgi:hypothetical protein